MAVPLRPLAALLEHDGPFASALLDVSRNTEDARHQLELLARDARERLMADGAPADLARQVHDRLVEPTNVPEPVGRFVVATDDGVVVDEMLPGWENTATVTFGPLPDVTSWLAYREATMAVLVVLADRVGADLSRYDAWGRGGAAAKRRVTGETLHVNKVPDGGMAMTDLQRHTEEVWRNNGRVVAAEVDRMIASSPPLIVLAGDPRAKHEILEAASTRVRDAVIEAEHGSRAPGSSGKSLEAEIDDIVRDALIGHRLSYVRDYQERTGRAGAVAHGRTAVLDDCVMGSVATVLMDAQTASQQRVRPDGHPGLALPGAARGATDLRGDLAVLAAGATTGSEAVFVGPATLNSDDGVAALLRWP